MVRKQSKFLARQKAGVAVIGVLALGVVAALTWQAVISRAPVTEVTEGVHYRLLEKPRRIRSDKVEVMEFFSYGCIHCYRLEPVLADWLETRSDRVELVRMPAVANDYWRLLGRAWFTLEQLGLIEAQHFTLFRAIHDQNRVFDSPDELFDFMARAGVPRDAFAGAFNSPQVKSRVARADAMARRLQVAAVPVLVVQGKYLVSATRDLGPGKMLEVVDHLVAKELAAAAGASAPEA